jgi:cytochrome c5
VTAQDVRFFQIFTYVLAGLVGFTVFIYFLSSVVADNTQRDWRSDDPTARAAVTDRLAPVGRVALVGEEKVTLTPAAASALSFLEPPAGAHGDEGAHGDAGDHGDAAMAESSDHSDGGDAGEMVDAAAEAGAAAAAMAGGVADAAETMVADATADLSGIDGSAIYNQGCNACHGMGVAGAPKTGDAAAWEARVAQGNDVLYSHAINGYNAMPAKGGFTYLSDEQVMAAVNYMVDQL